MNIPVAAKKVLPDLDRVSAGLRKLLTGMKKILVNVLAQVRVWRKFYPGLMHGLIFWGVTIQVTGTLINLLQMQLFIPFVELTFPRNSGYLVFELVMDLAGISILLGVFLAGFRRLVLRPKTLETRWDDNYALILLTAIPLAGFSLEGLRLLSAAPEWARWSPLGSLFAQGFRALGVSPELAAQIHPVLFWTHIGLGLTLIASIPFTKLRHLVQTPLYILLRPERKSSILEKIEDIEETDILGVGEVAEFTPIQLLSFDACVRCGRCEENCPAVLSGMSVLAQELYSESPAGQDQCIGTSQWRSQEINR